MTRQEYIISRLAEIPAELEAINAAIAAQGGVQEYTSGGEQTKLHPLNTLLAEKRALLKERMDLVTEMSNPPQLSAQSYLVHVR